MKNEDSEALQILLLLVVVPYLIYKLYQAMFSSEPRQDYSLKNINEEDKVNGGYY